MNKKTICLIGVLCIALASICCAGCITQPVTPVEPVTPVPAVDQIELITKAADLSNSVNPGNTNHYTLTIVGTYIEKFKYDNSFEEYYVVYGKISSITGVIFTDKGTTSWTHKFTEPVSITGRIPTTDLVIQVPKDPNTNPSIELLVTIPAFNASQYTAELHVVKGIFDQLHPWLTK